MTSSNTIFVIIVKYIFFTLASLFKKKIFFDNDSGYY